MSFAEAIIKRAKFSHLKHNLQKSHFSEFELPQNGVDLADLEKELSDGPVTALYPIQSKTVYSSHVQIYCFSVAEVVRLKLVR